MRSRTIIFCTSVVFFSAPSPAQTVNASFLHARVQGISDFPQAGSGYDTTWVRIAVTRDSDSKAVDLLLAYLGPKQAMPSVGSLCRFHVHKKVVSGDIGRTMMAPQEWTIIDNYTCDHQTRIDFSHPSRE
jgi:hypothetical protein